MVRQFHDSGFSGAVHPRNPERPVGEMRLVTRVEAVIAAKRLRHRLAAVGLVSDAVRSDADELRFSDQRALEPRHEEGGRSGRRLFVFSVFDLQDAARILYQSMLEAASRSEEWPAG